MLTAAIKGMFLIGVLSWYSASIFAMINNYFRNEVKEYLKQNPINPLPKSERAFDAHRNMETPLNKIELKMPSAVFETETSAITIDSENEMNASISGRSAIETSSNEAKKHCSTDDNVRFAFFLEDSHQCAANADSISENS